MTQAAAGGASVPSKNGRFAPIAAVVGCVLALVAAFHAPIAFVPAAIVCGVSAIAAGLVANDFYGAAGGLLAVLLAVGAALRSPLLWVAIIAGAVGHSANRGQTPPAVQSSSGTSTADIASAVREIEQFDQALAAFHPRVDLIEAHAGSYAQVTEALSRGVHQALILKQQGQSAFYTAQGQLFALNNKTEQLHAEMGGAQARFELKAFAINDQARRVAFLCKQGALSETESCRQARTGFLTFQNQVATVKAAIDHDNAAYEMERRQQSQMMARLS